MGEPMEGLDDAWHAFRPERRPSVVERSGVHPVEHAVDPVARAELRRSRQAVFGPDAPGPEMTAFVDRVVHAVTDREPFVPSPNGPSGSARMPAVPRRLPAPHEVVAAAPGRDPLAPGVLDGPESVPLPSAPALVCDGSDRIVRVNPALLNLAGRTAEGGAGLFGMRLPELVAGPDVDARLVRPDGGLVRVRVLRWDVPGRELRAVVLVELGASADDERAAEREARARAERSGRRFDDLVAVLPDGVALVDPGGRIVAANPALAALLGTAVEELRGCPIGAVAVDPSGARPASAFPEWLRLIRPGARYGYAVESVPLRRGDGTTAWADLRISVTSTDDGGWFWMVVCTDLAERHAAAEQLRRAARVDVLTGLPTRDGALELLEDLLIGPHRGPVAVVCAGVDDLRRVNSSLGHAAGDAAIVRLAHRLRDELPDGCTAARLGGDQFLVVCPDHLGEPVDLARAVTDVLAGGMIVGGRSVRLTASAGVAVAGVGRDVTAADLLRFAEVAMHDAKRRRAGVAVATDELVASAGAALELEAGLRAALAVDSSGSSAEGLVLHFQPVVGPDGVVRSAEALVRWQHPQRGTIPPGEFLPIAQRCGLLRELDLWVLRAATRQAARWPAHDGIVPAVAVNLAGLLPADPGFVAAVTGIVEASGLAWNRLVLELVESSLVEPSPPARAAMAELAARGVRFAVDDFGTGWSGLARLRELSPQVVKLDRAFVTGVASDPVDRAVARAVVQLAGAMGCAVVAEGVETPEQYRALRELGVEAFQGWLFARALPADGLRALLVGDRLTVPD